MQCFRKHLQYLWSACKESRVKSVVVPGELFSLSSISIWSRRQVDMNNGEYIASFRTSEYTSPCRYLSISPECWVGILNFHINILMNTEYSERGRKQTTSDITLQRFMKDICSSCLLVNRDNPSPTGSLVSLSYIKLSFSKDLSRNRFQFQVETTCNFLKIWTPPQILCIDVKIEEL